MYRNLRNGFWKRDQTGSSELICLCFQPHLPCHGDKRKPRVLDCSVQQRSRAAGFPKSIKILLVHARHISQSYCFEEFEKDALTGISRNGGHFPGVVLTNHCSAAILRKHAWTQATGRSYAEIVLPAQIERHLSNLQPNSICNVLGPHFL